MIGAIANLFDKRRNVCQHSSKRRIVVCESICKLIITGMGAQSLQSDGGAATVISVDFVTAREELGGPVASRHSCDKFKFAAQGP